MLAVPEADESPRRADRLLSRGRQGGGRNVADFAGFGCYVNIWWAVARKRTRKWEGTMGPFWIMESCNWQIALTGAI